MPNLLALSRELRDLIYVFVLNAPDDPPPSSLADSGERQEADDEPHHGCRMYYQHRMHVSSAALLLTNRQIHAEFAASVARSKKLGPLRYKLDCMLYEEEPIYPTWLSVPVLSSRVDVLEVDFRLFGDPEVSPVGFMSVWEDGPKGQSPILWGLCALLQRFTMRGPDFLSCEKGNGRIEVQNLVLNVIDDYVKVRQEFWVYYSHRDDIMHSEDVLRSIQQAMEHMLDRWTSPEPAFERMKTIVLMEDGVLWHRWIRLTVPGRPTSCLIAC